jgi:hypothetical protein
MVEIWAVDSGPISRPLVLPCFALTGTGTCMTKDLPRISGASDFDYKPFII